MPVYEIEDELLPSTLQVGSLIREVHDHNSGFVYKEPITADVPSYVDDEGKPVAGYTIVLTEEEGKQLPWSEVIRGHSLRCCAFFEFNVAIPLINRGKLPDVKVVRFDGSGNY